jgi:hypothetical protein
MCLALSGTILKGGRSGAFICPGDEPGLAPGRFDLSRDKLRILDVWEMGLVPVTASAGAQCKVSTWGGFSGGGFLVDSGKPASHKRGADAIWLKGECPERQRGRTVNPLAKPS